MSHYIYIYIYIKRLGHACSCNPEVLACPSGVQCLTHQTQTWQPKWSFCASMIKLFTSVNGFVVLGGVVWILLKKKQNGGERKVCKFMFVCESDSWKWIFPCAIRIFCSVINLYHYTWFSWETYVTICMYSCTHVGMTGIFFCCYMWIICSVSTEYKWLICVTS